MTATWGFIQAVDRLGSASAGRAGSTHTRVRRPVSSLRSLERVPRLCPLAGLREPWPDDMSQSLCGLARLLGGHEPGHLRLDRQRVHDFGELLAEVDVDEVSLFVEAGR